MGNCKSCLHWSGEPGEVNGLRRCLHIKVGRIPSPMTPDSAATLHLPDWVLPSCIIVGPDYGCIHHAPKDCREWDQRREVDDGRNLPSG